MDSFLPSCLQALSHLCTLSVRGDRARFSQHSGNCSFFIQVVLYKRTTLSCPKVSGPPVALRSSKCMQQTPGSTLVPPPLAPCSQASSSSLPCGVHLSSHCLASSAGQPGGPFHIACWLLLLGLIPHSPDDKVPSVGFSVGDSSSRLPLGSPTHVSRICKPSLL